MPVPSWKYPCHMALSGPARDCKYKTEDIENMNTNSTSKENMNPYGHLLDKYLDSNHVDWETRQGREEEAKRRYGHLIGFAKPDNSTLELMHTLCSFCLMFGKAVKISRFVYRTARRFSVLIQSKWNVNTPGV